jgi:TPR repeat protein
LYSKGLGVPLDHILTYMWFNLAATTGNKKAAEKRNLIAKLMTTAQVAEAQKLARAWWTKHKKK